MEKEKNREREKTLTTAAGTPVPDNRNGCYSRSPRFHAAAGYLVYQHSRK
jgi:hypothetical protein